MNVLTRTHRRRKNHTTKYAFYGFNDDVIETIN